MDTMNNSIFEFSNRYFLQFTLILFLTGYALDSILASIQTEKIPQVYKSNTKNEPVISGWSFYFDNDGFAGNSDDQGYSGGISISITGKSVSEFPLSLDPVLHNVDNWLSISTNKPHQRSTMEVGFTVFTPDDTNASVPLRNERPYASLFYLSNSRTHVNTINKTAVTTSLTFGMLGLKAAGKLQNSLHKNVGARTVRGWSNQISAGGEPTFRYSVAKQTVLISDYNNRNINFEVTDTVKFNVGYLTDVLWGLSFRAGQLHSPWWSFNPELEEYTEKSANTVSAHHNNNNSGEFYFWGGVNLRLRFYNAFLEGQFRDSAVTYTREELTWVTGELWIGITKQFSNGFRASYFLRSQTSEIKEGPADRNLVWGGIILSQSLM